LIDGDGVLAVRHGLQRKRIEGEGASDREALSRSGVQESREEHMSSPHVWARIAGLLYMLNIALSVFALVAVNGLFIPNDAAQTAENILAAEPTFRAAQVAILLANVAYIAVIAILFEVMKPAGRVLSTIAAFVGLAGCAVAAATGLGQITALYYLGDAAYLAAFNQDQLQTLARVTLREAGAGNTVALLFFGFYCLLLSGLTFRARFLPRWLGAPLLLAGAGWLVGVITSLLFPWVTIASQLLPVSGLGEALFTLWILIMGVNAERWREQAREAVARAGEI
jgi:hypothetical protein